MEPKTTNTESGQDNRGRRFEIVGEVVSNKMQKTISVIVWRSLMHKKYGKVVKRTSVFKAHDEKNEAQVGDKVLIVQSRPLSKTKRWKLVKVVEKAK
jgi:small subunit ribosomal protein S17